MYPEYTRIWITLDTCMDIWIHVSIYVYVYLYKIKVICICIYREREKFSECKFWENIL